MFGVGDRGNTSALLNWIWAIQAGPIVFLFTSIVFYISYLQIHFFNGRTLFKPLIIKGFSSWRKYCIATRFENNICAIHIKGGKLFIF